MIRIIKKLFYNDFGKFLISIILGLGLASLFRKSCKNRNCLIFKGPSIDKIQNKIYNHNNSCYKFNPESINCGTFKETIEFA